MTFTYYWKSSDNARHEGEIEATSRDEAFALLRARGVRAIKVEPKGWETGAGYRGVKRRVVVAIAIAAALFGAVFAWWVASPRQGVSLSEENERLSKTVIQKGGRKGRIESNVVEAKFGDRVAKPHPRKYIKSLAGGLDSVTCFEHPSENYLARFAMPGVDGDDEIRESAELVSDLRDALESEIVISANDPADIAELKRIVAGLKEEADIHLRSGSGILDFLKFLRLRQKMESDCRRRIVEEALMDGGDRERRLAEANGTLAAMGLAPME